MMSEQDYPKSISYSHAIKTVQEHAMHKKLMVETVGIEDALYRVAAENMVSPINVPESDCSQMDGYAINYREYCDNKEHRFALISPCYAGDKQRQHKRSEEGVYYATPIMTGALLPAGADTVVMKEHVRLEESCIRLTQTVKKSQHIRKVGSDLKVNQLLIRKSQNITVADLGLLSSAGISQLAVYRKPRVALMMTGDELVTVGQKRETGQVFDSVSLMLSQLLKQMGCEVTCLPALQDNPDAVTKQFTELLANDFQFVITVGGVSMGAHDLLPQAVATHGTIHFHKTLIKPGFPMLFGQLGQALYFGLPGNPVSAFATCFQFLFPAVKSMQSSEAKTLLLWRAELLEDVSKSHMKREFVRGNYVVNAQGKLEVMLCGEQQSSRIKSLAEANCFIVMNESQLELKRGQTVVIQPFSQLC